MNKFCENLIMGTFRLFYPAKYYGLEQIPEGRAVFVCNHFFALDPLFVFSVYQKKGDIYFLAKKELFRKKWAGDILKEFGAIPVDRENVDLQTMRAALRALKEDHKLVIFPEGTRNKKDDALQELKGGAAIFAVRTKSPIVPVMMLKRARLFRRTKLIFGEPFEFSEYYGKKLTEEDYRKLDAELREKMIALQSQLKALCAKKKGRNGNRTER